MYSYEIDQTLKSHNYTIDADTYIEICKTSPQIFHLRYNQGENKYEIWTNDNYYWKIEVYRKEN